MSILKSTLSTANRVISAVQSVADAVIALPEAIHEARSILVEQSAEKHLKLVKLLTEKDWKIDELESRLEKWNAWASPLVESFENTRNMPTLVGIRDFVASLQSRFEFAERIHNEEQVDNFEQIRALESELATLRAKDEPSIPEPDPGEGFEICAKNEATDWCAEHGSRWNPMHEFGDWKTIKYAFRRPIAVVKWVACTAEEARGNPGESEWMTSGDKWATMRVSPSNDFNRAFRSRAKLPEFAVVTRSIWDSEALASCERNRQVGLNDGDTWTYHIKRSDVPVGTVLG